MTTLTFPTTGYNRIVILISSYYADTCGMITVAVSQAGVPTVSTNTTSGVTTSVSGNELTITAPNQHTGIAFMFVGIPSRMPTIS